MNKKTVGVIFGGRSNEHEISCLSVVNVISSIDPDRWNIILIGITRDGRWLLVQGPESIKDGSWDKDDAAPGVQIDTSDGSLLVECGDRTLKQEEALEDRKVTAFFRRVRLDVVFPVLHGRGGEDGTIQGLLEMAGIPYVGCGVLSSAVSMDKFYTKIIVEAAGIRQARFVGIRGYELKGSRGLKAAADKVEAELGYPVFIKPSRSGSSVGVTRADGREALKEGLIRAAGVDSKILVEEFIDGREIECAVFGGGMKKVFASGVGEILAAAQFYDYDAKYNNPDSRTVTDPDLPPDIVEEIRRSACAIFNAVDGYGLARVDFFVERVSGEVVFNEINTMPGFTAISMYPMLMEARGVPMPELTERLLANALEREDPFANI